MGYEHLTDAERAHYDEYCNLRSIGDWAGCTPAQRERRDAARAWLDGRRMQIFRGAEGQVDGVAAGWEREDRRERYAMLTPETLLTARPRRRVRLPAGGCTPAESSYVEEREVQLALESTTPDERARTTANRDWLVNRRKQVFALAAAHGWEVSNRRARYHALSIATSHGTPFQAWKATHDPATGAPLPTAPGSSRQRALKWLAAREGITEQPPNSNTDNRVDGIRRAQTRCAGGGSGLVGTCWSGAWCWRALDVAGVPNIDTWWMASVDTIEKKARAADRCYRGWRDGFDTHGVLPGDQVVIGGHGVHVETVREIHADHVITNGGNTSSDSAGSQSDGGGAFRRRRAPGEVTGFALVDHVIDVMSLAQQLLRDDVTPEELTPDELAAKRAGDMGLAAPPREEELAIHQRIEALAPDPRYPRSDDRLPPELLDQIAATDEAARAADAAEEALVAGQEPADDPADGVILEPLSEPQGRA
jgi:hypothetical protein